MTPTTSAVTEMFSSLNLTSVMTDVMTGVTGQVTALLPIGIGIILALSLPSIAKGIIRSFI